MDSFIFDKITDKDIEEYAKSSNIFNMTDDDIKLEKVILASFEDERLGSSVEKLDIAVYNDGMWNVLDIDKKIEGFNEIPLGYILEDVEYERVLIVIRVMSSLLTDKVKSSIIKYMYYKVSDKYRTVKDNKAIFGKLAKNRVCLDDSYEMIKSLEDLGIQITDISI